MPHAIVVPLCHPSLLINAQLPFEEQLKKSVKEAELTLEACLTDSLHQWFIWTICSGIPGNSPHQALLHKNEKLKKEMEGWWVLLLHSNS